LVMTADDDNTSFSNILAISWWPVYWCRTHEYHENESCDLPQVTDKLYVVSSIHLHDRELSYTCR